MIQSYKDLEVYRRSYRASIVMYKIVKTFPTEELFGFTSQIKRAATSIPLNIAEGFGKHDTDTEFKRFLKMALGSANEMMVLIDMSKDLGFISSEVQKRMYGEYEEIAKMLSKLVTTWRSRS